ncbi:NAD(P)/FAD-dependent oxidoreductase [Paucihalobacter ruber]|uniref:NAD(P)/FAD-dependent oxidoreductase n=1 Tax=Paucihalobacter ruber TaxID=2567861 RepID=A0A506PQG1_9FLAO|nr:FAD-dependent oxidoreductase [Paucihalobacter ruber]TPV35944.1 NAD(P)/FAD-dependent oxidoreductase [Paucihalobacter ruber]
MTFDVLIIGGGAAGMSCALVLGSAVNKSYATDKQIGIVLHQKTSHLQTALFNNVLGLTPGTTGADILNSGAAQLKDLYSHVQQIENEKVLAVEQIASNYKVVTNKNTYHSKIIVIAVGYTNLISIKGLESYIEPHPRAVAEKQRIWLKNTNHLINKGLYVAGTLAGWRSQFAIASGSGAQVATDILTLWNDGKDAQVHDKI